MSFVRETNFGKESSYNVKHVPFLQVLQRGEAKAKGMRVCHLPCLTAPSYHAFEGDLPPAYPFALVCIPVVIEFQNQAWSRLPLIINGSESLLSVLFN